MLLLWNSLKSDLSMDDLKFFRGLYFSTLVQAINAIVKLSKCTLRKDFLVFSIK